MIMVDKEIKIICLANFFFFVDTCKHSELLPTFAFTHTKAVFYFLLLLEVKKTEEKFNTNIRTFFFDKATMFDFLGGILLPSHL